LDAREGGCPALIANRFWWLLLLLAWAGATGYSLHLRLAEAHRQSLEVATEGARDMFRMIVLARAWNASHGGVYVPVTPEIQPNPYLEHPRRDVVTTDGLRLTMVNPAFMTRLLSEMAYTEGGTEFHITSLKPIRPANAPDEWERGALESFERGSKESFEVVNVSNGRVQLRYMAPLLVARPCLTCHEKQGYKLGDIRGGISVSQDFGPIEAASLTGRNQLILLHASVFLLVAVVGGILLELLRRRWLTLADSVAALELAQSRLMTSNHALADARDAAEMAVQAKRAFLANISHEMRTPLNAVTGNVFLLRRQATEAQQRVLLDRIDAASRQLLEMIDKVLELSRLEKREVELHPHDFKLDIVLAEVFETLRRAAAMKGLVTRLEREPGLPDSLKGDARRIAQLLGCYIDNAVKFSEQGEIVLAVKRIAASPQSVQLRFELRDQGIGIPPTDQPSLFQIFAQTDMSATRRFGGAGTGLALAKQLASLMGGSVGVTSTPGAGSCFWFEVTLPVVRPIV
jgi:signal transduction histidine kinase